MVTKRQKRAVIKQLLIPIVLIIAALLYQPVRGWLGLSEDGLSDTTTDGGELVVSYIDVGQGDATLIAKGDFHMLIDAGDNQAGSTVVEYLKDQGVDKLDVLVGTHPDSDHIGGLDDVIENISVETVYMPEATKETKTYEEVENALSQAGLSAQMPQISTDYTYDENVVIRFLGPQKEYDDANDNSIVVQMAYGKNRFLFMGDAEEEAETDIVNKQYDLTCDVLKVGHHGSYTATSDTLLQAADPVYAVISCGEGNSYGHPHAEVLSRLEEDDVQIYRTDTMGTVQAISDGSSVRLVTQG